MGSCSLFALLPGWLQVWRFPWSSPYVWDFTRTTHRTQEGAILTVHFIVKDTTQGLQRDCYIGLGLVGRGGAQSVPALSGSTSVPAYPWGHQPRSSSDLIFLEFLSKFHCVGVIKLLVVGNWTQSPLSQMSSDGANSSTALITWWVSLATSSALKLSMGC